MGKFDDVMKTEIARLTRKELRPLIVPLQREVRELTRQVKALQGQVQQSARRVEKQAPPQRQAQRPVTLEAPASEVERARISPGLIKKLRGKQGITQGQLAGLLGVSAAAVQSWEQGIARPGEDNKSALVALRQKSRNEVEQLLEEKGIGKAIRKPRTVVTRRKGGAES